MTFSDSGPHIEGLKLFKKNNRPFVESFLQEPWFFNFDLSSTFSEEKNDLIKEKYIDDYKMSNLFLEKVKDLPQQKYISNKLINKEMADNRMLKDCFFRYFKFLFDKIFYEIYKNNYILYHINQQKISEIKFFTINIDLVNSSQINLLCTECLNTCFIG